MSKDKIILFKKDSCPACQRQMQILKTLNKGKTLKGITIYDLNKNPAPDYIKDSKGNISVPTWVIIKRGVIDPSIPSILGNKKSNGNTRNTRNTNFGVSEINSLVTSGKNGINVSQFHKDNTWEKATKDLWGNENYLMSGSYGRDLGPNPNTDPLFTNRYNNDIRMVRPGGPEDAYPMFNYNCNLKPPLESGLYSDSTGPMKFGQTKSKGEYQYYYNDYPPEPINLYSGAGGGQGDYNRPTRINNDLFIGSFFGKPKSKSKSKSKVK